MVAATTPPWDAAEKMKEGLVVCKEAHLSLEWNQGGMCSQDEIDQKHHFAHRARQE